MLQNSHRRTPKRERITMRDFYLYRLACRQYFDPEENRIVNFSPIHHGAKLFQQLCIDMWTKIEGNNLEWFRQRQTNLRVEMYSGLMDYIQNQSAANNYQPGRVFVLPSTHQVDLH